MPDNYIGDRGPYLGKSTVPKDTVDKDSVKESALSEIFGDGTTPLTGLKKATGKTVAVDFTSPIALKVDVNGAPTNQLTIGDGSLQTAHYANDSITQEKLNLTTPSNDSDAATKSYVDGLVSSGQIVGPVYNTFKSSLPTAVSVTASRRYLINTHGFTRSSGTKIRAATIGYKLVGGTGDGVVDNFKFRTSGYNGTSVFVVNNHGLQTYDPVYFTHDRRTGSDVGNIWNDTGSPFYLSGLRPFPTLYYVIVLSSSEFTLRSSLSTTTLSTFSIASGQSSNTTLKNINLVKLLASHNGSIVSGADNFNAIDQERDTLTWPGGNVPYAASFIVDVPVGKTTIYCTTDQYGSQYVNGFSLNK